MKKGSGILVSIGKWDGMYKARKEGMLRIGLGCIAFTFMPFDGDKLLTGIMKQGAEIEKLKKDYDAARCIVKEVRDCFSGLEKHESFEKTIKSIDDYLSGLDPYSGVYEEMKILKTALEEIISACNCSPTNPWVKCESQSIQNHDHYRNHSREILTIANKAIENIEGKKS